MTVPRPAFTVGIEEEYLLVDRETRGLVRNPPQEVLDACVERLGEQVTSEFLRAQIEVGTRVCRDIAEAREDLKMLRRTVDGVARGYGMAVIASSTHPFAAWHEQQVTDKERYNIFARDLQAVARRLVICGMHVHVGIENPDLRIDLLNQAAYFLPHLLALSTSSPFWQGIDTGLKSYRKSVFAALPRTGLPQQFSSWAEYQRHVDALIRTGVIEDASMLWWDIRPSARFPTVEMRITDICTNLEDGLTIAAIYLSLMGMLFDLRRVNQRWRTYADMLVSENIWRAQRYGVSDSLVDFGKMQLVPFSELAEELVALVWDEAAGFGCQEEVQGVSRILERGTSADRQLSTYAAAVAAGADHDQALREVVDMLISDTEEGL
jgi:carboxylate-amine ligase